MLRPLLEAAGAVYAATFVIQALLAWRYVRRNRIGECSLPAITVLQPILSGDPDLGPNLRANLRRNAEARFVWLVDDDDAEGQQIAHSIARECDPGGSRVVVSIGPGPSDGENPKLAKLARCLPDVRTPLAVVLDDDTVLPPGELSRLAGDLERSDLVTGLPVFVARRTWYERLVGGFVNGNAVLTYFPAAALGVQRTINGMIYGCRTETLRRLGGFEAVKRHLTDDFAMAMLFHRAGLRVFQAPVFVEVSMTIRDLRHYCRVMRRWMIFANRYLAKNTNPATLVLVGLPAFLPLTGLAIAVKVGATAVGLWIAGLAARAVVNWWTWRRAPADILAEVIASLLLPLFYVSALIRPDHLSWRKRKMELSGGIIRYR